MTSRIRPAAAVAALAAVLLLAGCATQPAPETPAPTSSPTMTPAPQPSTSTPAAGSPYASMTPEQLRAALTELADRSCGLADADGYTLTGADGERLVVMGDGADHQGYSAFVTGPDGTSELIYELDLTPCSLAYALTAPGPADDAYTMTVETVAWTGDAFDVAISWGGNDLTTLRYTVADEPDGVLGTQTVVDADGPERTAVIGYGVTTQDTATLAALVDALNP